MAPSGNDTTAHADVIKIMRDVLSKQSHCFMPCACLDNPQTGDCGTRAREIAAAIAYRALPSEEEIAKAICKAAGWDWKDEATLNAGFMSCSRAVLALLHAGQPTNAMAWKPIETAPTDGDFLVAFRSGYVTRGRLINGKYLASDSAGPSARNTDTTATHWQPVPAAPVLTSGLRMDREDL
jgi:hypothetical protein